MKRIKALFLSVMLALGCFSFSGCKSNSEALTIFMGIPDENGSESTFVKYLEENLDVKINITYLTGDLYTAVSKMVAGGTYPDMIYAVDATNVVLEGNIALSLDDYLKTGGENIKKIYGQDLEKAKSAQGGSLKYLPWDRGSSDITTPDGAVYIAKRVLEYYADKNNGEWPVIRTMDQYFSIIEDFIANNPTIALKDSKGSNANVAPTGVSFITDVNYDYFFQGAPLRMAGYPNDGNLIVNQETLECESVVSSDYAKKFFSKLNAAYKKGLIPLDVFSKSESQYRSDLVQGKVLGTLFLQDWYLGEINGELREKNPDSTFVPMPVVIDETVTDERYRLAPEMVTRDGLIITDNCKNPDKAFELLEFICSEEAQVKLRWGTEGVTYSKDADGKFIRTKEQIEYLQTGDNNKNEGLIQRPWPTAKPTEYYSNGSLWAPNADPKVIADSFKEVDKEVLSHYGINTYSELFKDPVGTLYGQAWDTVMPGDSAGALANEAARTKMRVLHPNLVQAANFETAWNTFANTNEIKNHYLYADATEILIKKRANEWFGKNFQI